MVGEGEPPEAGEVEAEEEVVVAVALAYVTALVSLACEYPKRMASALPLAVPGAGPDSSSGRGFPAAAAACRLLAPSRSRRCSRRRRCGRSALGAALGAPGSLPSRQLWCCRDAEAGPAPPPAPPAAARGPPPPSAQGRGPGGRGRSGTREAGPSRRARLPGTESEVLAAEAVGPGRGRGAGTGRSTATLGTRHSFINVFQSISNPSCAPGGVKRENKIASCPRRVHGLERETHSWATTTPNQEGSGHRGGV